MKVKVTRLDTAAEPLNSKHKGSPVESSGPLPEPSTLLPGKPTTTTGITKGKWVKGQSGNPKGKPKDLRTIAVLKNDLELAVREKLAAATVSRIVNRMVDIALGEHEDPKHSISAAKLILDMAISKAAVQEQANQRPAISIIIENATMAAQKLEEQSIEATYSVVSSEEN
jgi:hypothetical protein